MMRGFEYADMLASLRLAGLRCLTIPRIAEQNRARHVNTDAFPRLTDLSLVQTEGRGRALGQHDTRMDSI